MESTTDEYPDETVVTLHRIGRDGSDDITMFENFPLKHKNSLYTLPSEDEYICLEDNECYSFFIFDYYEDGMSEGQTGSFRGILGGDGIEKFVFKGNGSFGCYQYKAFCTGSECDDSKQFAYNGNLNCNQHLKPYKTPAKELRAMCREKWEGQRVYDWCPLSCGHGAGLGRCGYMFDHIKLGKDFLDKFIWW